MIVSTRPRSSAGYRSRPSTASKKPHHIDIIPGVDRPNLNSNEKFRGPHGFTNHAMEPDNHQVKMINVTPHSINMPSSDDHTFERHPSVFTDNSPPQLQHRNKSPTGLPPRRTSTEIKMARMGIAQSADYDTNSEDDDQEMAIGPRPPSSRPGTRAGHQMSEEKFEPNDVLLCAEAEQNDDVSLPKASKTVHRKPEIALDSCSESSEDASCPKDRQSTPKSARVMHNEGWTGLGKSADHMAKVDTRTKVDEFTREKKKVGARKSKVTFAENPQITHIVDRIAHEGDEITQIEKFDDQDLQNDIEKRDEEIERAMNQSDETDSRDLNNNESGKTSGRRGSPPSVRVSAEEDLNSRVAGCLREMKTNMCRIKARIFVRNYEQTVVDLRKVKQKLDEIYRERFAGEKGDKEVGDQVKTALYKIAEKEKSASETAKKHGALLGIPGRNLSESARACQNYCDWNQLSSQCFYLNSVMLKGHSMAGNRSKKDLNDETKAFISSFGYRAAKTVVQTVLNEDMSVSLIINKIDKLLEEAKNYKEMKAEESPDKIGSSGGNPGNISPGIDTANLELFCTRPAPQGFTMKCRVTRDKKGLDRHAYPTYFLHLERDDGKKIFLLAGRKRKKSKTSNYLISVDATDLSRNGESFIGKLRSNVIGTKFTVYNSGVKYGKSGLKQDRSNQREELALICYDTNVLGFKGPRKMTVVIPGMNSDHERVPFVPNHDKETIQARWQGKKMDNLIELSNKTPIWNDDMQSYVLNFKGRVTQGNYTSEMA